MFDIFSVLFSNKFCLFDLVSRSRLHSFYLVLFLLGLLEVLSRNSRVLPSFTGAGARFLSHARLVGVLGSRSFFFRDSTALNSIVLLRFYRLIRFWFDFDGPQSAEEGRTAGVRPAWKGRRKIQRRRHLFVLFFCCCCFSLTVVSILIRPSTSRVPEDFFFVVVLLNGLASRAPWRLYRKRRHALLPQSTRWLVERRVQLSTRSSRSFEMRHRNMTDHRLFIMTPLLSRTTNVRVPLKEP